MLCNEKGKRNRCCNLICFDITSSLCDATYHSWNSGYLVHSNWRNRTKVLFVDQLIFISKDHFVWRPWFLLRNWLVSTDSFVNLVSHKRGGHFLYLNIDVPVQGTVNCVINKSFRTKNFFRLHIHPFVCGCGFYGRTRCPLLYQQRRPAAFLSFFCW